MNAAGQVLTAGELGTFRGGSGFPVRYQGKKSGDLPFFKVSDMNSDGNELFMTRANNYISEARRKALGAVRMPKRAIVFAKVGAAVFQERKRILAQDSCIDNNMAAFIVDEDKLDVRFAHYLLTAFKMSELVAVGALPSLNGGQLRSIPLLVPNDLAEQRRIAAALADADDLIAVLERLIAKKQAIKQGMMQQLLTGFTRLPGFTEKWTETRLGDILKFQAGFPFPSHQFSEEPSGVRLVRNRDLRSDDATVFIRGHVPGDYVLDTGDVLIGMDGDFEPVIWQGGPAALNQRVGRLRFSSRSHAGFIAYALVAPLKDLEYGTGATTVKHLSHSDVENLVMTIPPVAEQAAIAQVLIDSDVAIDALRLRLTKARAIKQGMMQELLTGRTRLPVEEGAG